MEAESMSYEARQALHRKRVAPGRRGRLFKMSGHFSADERLELEAHCRQLGIRPATYTREAVLSRMKAEKGRLLAK